MIPTVCVECGARYQEDIEYCSCGGDVVPDNSRLAPRAAPPSQPRVVYIRDGPVPDRRKEIVRGIMGRPPKRLRL